MLGVSIWDHRWCVLVILRLIVPRRETHTSFPSSLGPYGANIINPRGWASSVDGSNTIVLEFTRVVLAIGVFAIGVELPKAYMKNHWKSIFFLLFPVMTWVSVLCLFMSAITLWKVERATFVLTISSPGCSTGLAGLRWTDLCFDSRSHLPRKSRRCCMPHTHRSHSRRCSRRRQMGRQARTFSHSPPAGR